MPVSHAALGCAAILFMSASVLAACGNSSASSTGTTSGSGGTSSSTGTSSSQTGTGGAGGATTTSTGTGPFAVGPHGDAPQIVNPYQGNVIASPKIQVISYAEDPTAVEVDKFLQELLTTPTWSQQASEYGVGAFTVLPTISIPGTPPTTLDDDGDPSPFQTTLATNLSGANPAWGAADPSTIYLFLMPLGTNITSQGDCCSGFLGYHWDTQVGSTSVPYGIVCDCPAYPMDPITPLQYVTTTVTHEMVEAATDPFVSTTPAFSQVDDADFIWTIATGGEVADMCEYDADSNYLPPGATYMVQRSWSNAAAKAGKQPCVPAASSAPYFNSQAVLPDNVKLDYYGEMVTTKGITIPVGQSKTIDVQLFSEAPTSGPWTVTAYDLNDYLGNKAETTVTLDKNTGSNGDTLHLTIQVLSADKTYKGEGFVLVSDLDGQENMTFGAVGN